MLGHAFSTITYNRGEEWDAPTKKKPYHWAFFVQTGTTPYVRDTFQLRGMPGLFYYSAEESVDLSKVDGENGQL